jgi:heme exporter protein C
MHKYASPKNFYPLAGTLIPWLAGLTALLLLAGLYLGLFVAPPDYQQGETVRIMFVHVPAAWMALFVYTIMALASGAAFVFRHPLADAAAKAAAPIGTCFCFLALATGSIWGKPTWGTWWTWDARLTSTALLFVIYLAYLLLRSVVEDPERAAVYAAVLGIVGALDVPIIHFSVEWWRTLHQPATMLRPQAPTMDRTMLVALLVNVVAFLVTFAYLFRRRYRLLGLEADVRARAWE